MRGCKKYQKHLSALMDGELSGKREKALVDHLESCGFCRKTLQRWEELYEVLEIPVTAAPPFFAEKVRRRIFTNARPVPNRSILLQRILAPAAAAAAAAAGILLGIFIGYHLNLETQQTFPNTAPVSDFFEIANAPLTSAFLELDELDQ